MLGRLLRFYFAFLMGLFLSANLYADSSSLADLLGSISVQHGGRVKPFESFARESVLYVTGKTSYHKIPATILVWSWMADGEKWSSQPMIYVSHPELRKKFSSDLVHNRISPALILADLDFLKDVEVAQQKNQMKEKLNPIEDKTLELYSRAQVFEEIRSGLMPGFIPHPDHPTTSWVPIQGIVSNEGITILKSAFPEDSVAALQDSCVYFLGRMKQGNFELAVTSAQIFKSDLEKLLSSRGIGMDEFKIKVELFYWHFRPFSLASLMYALSLVFWMFTHYKPKVKTLAFSVFTIAFLFHTLGFILRIVIAGRPPVSNMYESIIWVAWGAVLFSWILWFFYRSSLIPMVSASVAVLALLIGESLPAVLDPAIKPLVPVLRSNYWLTIHVLTITLGYAAFLLNWGIAHVLVFNLTFHPSKKKNLASLTEFLYRSLQIGLMFLSAGTILGGVWAADSWGRFWGWDPKETWALIAILAYLAVLHARTAGWLDSFGVAFYSIICFLCVLMAWYGVNFVLAAGLHSYGFGGGGVQYVLTVIAIDFLFLAYCTKKCRSHTIEQ